MEVKVLAIKEDILGANKERARKNQKRLEEHTILGVNVMSSPGAGKTSLILKTIERFKAKVRMAVIEGDIASRMDADKVHQQGVPVIQINTGGACHLDANMIEQALNHLSLEQVDLILIENVGNLVCPAEFALGVHKKIMLLSVPEGDDKPHKYPLMFTEVDVVLVNKIDVLPYFDFDMSSFIQAMAGLNPAAKVFKISCRTNEGLEAWFFWLQEEINQIRRKKQS